MSVGNLGIGFGEHTSMISSHELTVEDTTTEFIKDCVTLTDWRVEISDNSCFLGGLVPALPLKYVCVQRQLSFMLGAA
jgi:hypothetical protein